MSSIMFQNNSDCSCNSCSTQQKYFEIAKNFKELTTEVQKAQARRNLGISDEYSLKWGNIKGFIEKQKDLTQYLNNYKSALGKKLDKHISDTNNPHNITKTQVGLSNVTNDAQVKRSEMGVAGGVATLDIDGKVPALQLPADEEDVTAVDGKIKFKDRDTTNGMGYVILRKNKSFSEQVTKSNTIYEIRYNFILEKDITIPINCILKFNGGSISGGHTIIGQNTSIEAKLIKIFNTDVTLVGIWNVTKVYPEWFGAKGDSITDDYEAFKSCLALGGIIYLQTKNYYIGHKITINNFVHIKGCGSNDNYNCSILSFGAGHDTPAITINEGADYIRGYTLMIEDCIIQPKDWETHDGVGFDLTRCSFLRNVVIRRFKDTNLFLHHDLNSEGPYNSLFEQCKFIMSGSHGVVVGRGANNISFIQCCFHWNGAPSYGEYISEAGDYDGLLITGGTSNTGNTFGYLKNNAFPSFDVQEVSIIGGSACHNSRYGYNISQLSYSTINLGYAERNFLGLGQTSEEDTNQIYFGNGCKHINAFIGYTTVNGIVTNAYEYRNTVKINMFGKTYDGRYGHVISGVVSIGDKRLLGEISDGSIYESIPSKGQNANKYVKEITNNLHYIKKYGDKNIEEISGNTITKIFKGIKIENNNILYIQNVTVDTDIDEYTLRTYFNIASITKIVILGTVNLNGKTFAIDKNRTLDLTCGQFENGTVNLGENLVLIIPLYNKLVGENLTIWGNPAAGTQKFDNGMPLWYNGTAWVDATGTPI